MVVLAIGAVTGVVLVLVGLRPTGSVQVDAGLCVAASMFIVWAGCTAPWQVLTVCSAVACALAPPWIGTGAGVLLIAISGWIGYKVQTQPVYRAATIGGILVLLSFAGSFGVLGLSAVVGSVVVATLTVTSLRRRPSSDRKLATRIALGVAGFAAIALVGLIAALAGARNGIDVGSAETKAGLGELRTGNVSGAVEDLNRAEDAFASASRSANAPWAQLARLIPVAAQYRATAVSLTDSAHTVAGVGTDSLRSVDPQSLRITNGKIDVNAVTAMREPVAELQTAIGGFESALNEAQSDVWLPSRVTDRLKELSADIADQQQLGNTLIDWIDIAPELLGANGPRTYFLMFTTPAEARGQGGFMGNYAELTADNGAIAMTGFGRHSDLDAALPDDYVLTGAPEDWMNRFGPYGFRSGDQGVVAQSAWAIIDMSAHFPNTAQVISALYPASGGKHLDGVFSLDVYGIQALVGLVGPIEVEGAPTLTGENTADYLLVGQYLGLDQGVANVDRVDMLARVAGVTVDRLLNTNPPDPVALGKALAPLAHEGRVLAWSSNPEIEEMFVRADLDGRVLDADELAAASAGNGLQLVVNNGAGSKIDSYLVRSSNYDDTTGTVTFNYTNTAPSSGLSNYIIGDSGGFELPPGTSLLLATLYSTVPLDSLTVDGQPVVTEPAIEADRFAYEFQMLLTAGASARVTAVLPPGAGEPVIIDQPLVRAPGS